METAIPFVVRAEHKTTLDQDDILKLRRIILDLSDINDKTAAEISKRAAGLIAREYERRDAVLRIILDSLLAKKERGETLTAEESQTLNRVSALLSGDH